MCMFGSPSRPPPPVPPKEYAQQKAPSRSQTKSAGERIKQQIRSRPGTMLTRPGEIKQVETVGLKTLKPTPQSILTGKGLLQTTNVLRNP
ncbi:MAG: hypothetical protein JKY10_00810 [Cohaesibacteraceae bacterium]|nr:hypothetical protein [Cohaesibacteraceae bacterium]